MEGEKTYGKVEDVKEKSSIDTFLYDSTNAIKVGIRQELGGSIVFFGETGTGPGINNTNTIDDNDSGREVQFAMYDASRLRQGCAYNASCYNATTQYECVGSCCGTETYYLGWNPVQGGNRCNKGSGIESISTENGELKVVTKPLQWNPMWNHSDCQSTLAIDQAECIDPSLNMTRSDVLLTQTIRFIEKHVIEIQYTVKNLTDISHQAYPLQEMPTLYAARGDGMPDLYVLMKDGNIVVPIDKLINNKEQQYTTTFDSGAPWVTLQNANHDYGVGILYENGHRNFSAFQIMSPQYKHFNNVRANIEFGLPANGTVSARSYLMLGAYKDIADTANRLIRTIPPFGVMDYPDGKSAVSGNVDVSGWALDNKGVAKIEARIDEGTRVALSYGSSRPDVCSAWPGYPKCNHVGYSGKISVTGLDKECAHLLEIIATDTDNNERVIDRRLLNVQ